MLKIEFTHHSLKAKSKLTFARWRHFWHFIW